MEIVFREGTSGRRLAPLPVVSCGRGDIVGEVDPHGAAPLVPEPDHRATVGPEVSNPRGDRPRLAVLGRPQADVELLGMVP